MEQKLSHARSEDAGGPTRLQDEFGNMIPQPSATAMYGGPSRKGGAAFPASTGEADAFITGYYGGEAREPGEEERRAAAEHDPTQRRGTTTGEYEQAGVGLMDRAKEKLDNIGGFKEDPGHVNTAGDPMEATKLDVDKAVGT